MSVTRFASRYSLPLWLAFCAPACSSPSNSVAGTGARGGSQSAGAGGSSAGAAVLGGTGGSVQAGAGGHQSGGATGGGAGAHAGQATAGGTAGVAGTGGTGASAGTGGSLATGGIGGTNMSGGRSGAGGLAGTNGTTGGSAGAAAGGAAGSGAAGSSSGTDCASLGGKLLCEDFESEMAGSLPMGAPWAAPNCSDSTHTLKVDGGAHHSGAQSLLGENIPYADCQLHADLGMSLTEYWVRAWVYYGTAAPTSSTHEVSVFELVPAASTDDPSIRVGYRGDTCMPVGVELNITGGGQEETGCTGAVPVANQWYCYVLHVKQAASSVTADLSIDGVDQSYTNHGSPQTEITSQVANIRYLRLGPRSYSGNFANPIYVDDVAVATQELGCQ